MYFAVWSAKGLLLYDGESWPMARAALDAVIARDERPTFVALPVPNPDEDGEP